MTAAELEQALEHESGLLALGGTGDVATLIASSEEGARLALEVFAYRVAQAVAAMATVARRPGRPGVHRRRRGERRACS